MRHTFMDKLVPRDREDVATAAELSSEKKTTVGGITDGGEDDVERTSAKFDSEFRESPLSASSHARLASTSSPTFGERETFFMETDRLTLPPMFEEMQERDMDLTEGDRVTQHIDLIRNPLAEPLGQDTSLHTNPNPVQMTSPTSAAVALTPPHHQSKLPRFKPLSPGRGARGAPREDNKVPNTRNPKPRTLDPPATHAPNTIP
jgi:hypothetical protein